MQQKIYNLFQSRAKNLYIHTIGIMHERLIRLLQKLIPKHSHEEDPNVETQYGRRIPGGSFGETIERFWDRTQDGGSVEGVLRPTTREGKDEAIRRAKAEAKARNTQIVELTKRPGYNVLVAFLSKIEKVAYYQLRHPEIRKDNINLEYFNGIQNGRIDVVEEIRAMFTNEIVKHYGEVRRQNENKDKGDTQ